MTRIRLFNSYTDWPYMYDSTRAIACADTCGVTACDESDGRLYGMVVFDQMTANSAQCHIAITHPIRAKRLIKSASTYIFDVLGKEIIYGLVPSDNEKAIHFDKHIGFKEIMRLNDLYAKGVDYVLLKMCRADCRWLEQRVPYQLDLFEENEVCHG